MPEKINIASLQIDFSQVIKKSAEYKAQIDKLKKSQKDLDKTTEEGQAAFAKMDVEIKNLNKSYRDNQSFARALDNANEDLNKTMSTQNKSTQELRDSRSQLNQISKQLGRNQGELTGNLEEEIELREQLNVAIDEQTEALREQSSEFNGSKDQIGEYTEGINRSDLSLSGLINKSKEAGGVNKLLANSFKGAISGMWGMVKASIAFILTPVGAILALLVGAFLLVKNAMNRSEESTNKIKKAFAAFGGIVSGLLKALQPLGDFLINYIVWYLGLVEKAIFATGDAFIWLADKLGFDEAAESMREFKEEIEAAAKSSQRLVEAQLELDKAQRIAKKTQLEFQKDAEKLRQIRDDEKKTIAERVKANEDLDAVLKEQLKTELAIAGKALVVANLRIQAEGETKEALDAQAEALTEIVDIQERIAGQESEQLANLNSLRRDAAAQQKKIQEDAIKKQNEEIDLFIKQQGIRAKTLEEGLELERKVSDKKKKILEDELKAGLITREKFDAEILDLQNNLLQKQAELAVENASRELEAYNEKNKTKLDSDKFLTEELFNEEKRRLELLAEQQRAFEAKRLEEGVISQTEFNAAINDINEENRTANEELDAERKEAKKEQEAVDFENKLEIQAEQNENEFEIRSSQLAAERIQELKNAEKTGADKNLINKKYDAFEKTLNKDLVSFKNEQNAQVLSGLASLFGESSDLGKAFAIAEIATNTVQNASKAFSQAAVFASNPLTLPLAVNANIQGGIIIATGAAQAAKASGIKLASGGMVVGAGSSKSDSIEALLSNGESVNNANSTSMFAPLYSYLNVLGGGKPFKAATGGIAGSTSSSNMKSIIDLDAMAAKMAEANESLPSPVVSVEEITERANEVAVIESDASFS
jgi:hypothetical protein